MVPICKECNKQSRNESNLNRHVKAVHDESEEPEDETEEMNEKPDAFDGGDEVSSDDDEPENNVWNPILDQAQDSHISVLESFNVMFCRSLRRYETYPTVLKTLEIAKGDKNMDSSEALVDKRFSFTNQKIRLNKSHKRKNKPKGTTLTPCNLVYLR